MKHQSGWFRWIAGALALAALPSVAGAVGGPRPVGLDRGAMSDERIDQRFLGFTDVELLRFQDRIDTERVGAERVPFRVAEPQQAGFDVDRHGTWETLADGGSLWRLRVTSPGALFLSFMLAEVALPPGAELRFYSVERDHQFGPYTAAIHNAERRFGSPAIAGDSAVIELHVPAAVPFRPRLVVESVSHGYRDFNHFARVPFRNRAIGALEVVVAEAEACEVDVNCSQGSAWQADKRAVARTYDGRYLCTGSLLNNARQDCRPLFLTAAHCVDRDRTAAGMTFYWNFENSTCGGNDAPTSQTSSGAAVRATSTASDFTLLELNARPNAAYSTYYAGFSRSAEAPASAITIHHPAGDPKKISFENDPVLDGGNFSGGWGGTHWRIVGWDVGTTEGGSSGCPLFNASHQVVGQLHGGTANCAGGWDEYGKLSSSWGAGLASFLDPDGSGLTTLGGKESSTCTGGGGTCGATGTACTTGSQCCSGSCSKKTKTCG